MTDMHHIALKSYLYASNYLALSRMIQFKGKSTELTVVNEYF